MDFNDLEIVTEKAFVQLRHPATNELLFDIEETDEFEEDGETKKVIKHPVGAYIYGQDSEPFKKRKRQLQDQKMEAVISAGKKKISAEDIEKDAMATVCACVDSFVRIKFQDVNLTDQRGLFPAFFRKHPWAQEQIDREIMKRENFLKASQAT